MMDMMISIVMRMLKLYVRSKHTPQVKCHITYVQDRKTGHLVYDKFRHKSQPAYSYTY